MQLERPGHPCRPHPSSGLLLRSGRRPQVNLNAAVSQKLRG
jgi:hypothetical protein